MVKKYLFTFGIGTAHKNKCVIIETENENQARNYVYQKYGQENVSSVYDYKEWAHLIQKYKYKVVRNIKL